MVDNDYNPNKSDDDDEEEEEDKEDEFKNGILINSTYPLTDCAKKFKENDVLLEIDGVRIGEDGTIKYPFPEDGVSRINYTYITSNKFCGDMVNCKVLREGSVQNIEVMVDVIDYLVPIVLYNRPVTYYVFGGFVFLPLSRPYLRAEYGSKWSSKCAVTLKDLYFNGYKKEKGEEVVILSRVLASDLNVGFHKFSNCVLNKVNDVEVKNIKHLIDVIETAVNDGVSRFIHFSFEHNVTMVLEIDLAIKGLAKIMKEHKIKYDRSPNLREDDDNVQMSERKIKKKRRIEEKKVFGSDKTVKIIDDLTDLFDKK